MKKALSFAITLSIILSNAPLYCADQALHQSDYEANEGYEKSEPLGYGSNHATHASINMSMMGWGIGAAAAIAIIAGVVHQSTAAHADLKDPTQKTPKK